MNLVYVDPGLPGISRFKMRGGWGYRDARGVRITDHDEIDRLNRVALPPAYRDAWFCPSPDGHIQAIGYDDKGRRQYRYHAAFRSRQDDAKYERCADFGRALPLLRAQVSRDLTGKPTDRDTVIAAIVRLLDLGRIRIGNESYARSNKSFGATTLRTRHAQIKGGKLALQYRAKSGVMRKLTISDRGLLRVVRKVQDLPGQNLFQYLGEDGDARNIGSADVNSYIREAMGGDFTAKHFRTWAASAIALEQILLAARGKQPLKLAQLLVPVAEALGNTPTIARKSYVHPAVIARVGSDGAAIAIPRKTRWLSGVERALLVMLDEAGAALSKAA